MGDITADAIRAIADLATDGAETRVLLPGHVRAWSEIGAALQAARQSDGGCHVTGHDCATWQPPAERVTPR